jgi:hypothetical protein
MPYLTLAKRHSGSTARRTATSVVQVLPRDVAVLCSKRPDIHASDVAHIEQSCERRYQQWLASQKGRRDVRHDRDGDGERNMLANMYKRIVKAVGIAEE